MKTETQRVVISGGLGSIGRASAVLLAKQGFEVHVLYHETPRQEVESFMRSLHSGDHGAYECDLTSQSSVSDAIGKVAQKREGIDICIHAAVSPLIRKRITAIDPYDFKDQFEVSVFGALHLFQAVVPHMRSQGQGRLIGLTTAALLPDYPPTTMSGYICAKHALRGLLKEFLYDVSNLSITVNAVAPDFVHTDLHKDLPDRAIDFLRDLRSDKKLATSEDVAKVIAHICSPQTAAITGMTFPVDGSTPYPL